MKKGGNQIGVSSHDAKRELASATAGMQTANECALSLLYSGRREKGGNQSGVPSNHVPRKRMGKRKSDSVTGHDTESESESNTCKKMIGWTTSEAQFDHDQYQVIPSNLPAPSGDMTWKAPSEKSRSVSAQATQRSTTSTVTLFPPQEAVIH